MNFSIVIPQVFYDVIARVFPGFLLLSMLRLTLYGTSAYGLVFPQFVGVGGAVDQALSSIGTVLLSYFAGWALRGLTWRSWPEWTQSDQDINQKFQEIRLKNPEAGFRIVKLRAEARMLEASRTAMLLVAGVVVLVLVLRFPGVITATVDEPIAWLFRLFLPTVLCLVFWKLERPHWEIYFGNVRSIHRLINDRASSSVANSEHS